MKPFINTAVIGNGRILAALGSQGELHRLFWPNIDSAQHINNTWPALLSPNFGDKAVRFAVNEGWAHSQEYVSDSNILKTESWAEDKNLHITMLDFIVPDQDILVRYYKMKNTSIYPLPLVFLYFASLYLDESRLYNSNCFDLEHDTLLHYRRDTWFAVAGNLVPTAFQCGCGGEDSLYGNLNGNSIALSPDGCQAWDLGMIEPGQDKIVAIFLAAGRTREQVQENVFYARRHGWDGLLKETTSFWEAYLKKGCLPVGAGRDVEQLFKHSVIVSKLLMNRETGGIIAAPEFDESYSHSGGYAYCWARDGAFIAHAMLKAGYPEYARDFYRWAADHQDPGGGWPQRQYTSGDLAPGWGYQIDETGTVLWGISEYFEATSDSDFVEEIWPAVNKAAEFLMNSLDGNAGLPQLSYDLWEERFGEHAYSSAAVYAGLRGAGRMAGVLGQPELAVKWRETAVGLRKKILEYFWDPGLNMFIRSAWVAVERHEFDNREGVGDRVRKVTGPKGNVSYQVFGDGSPDASLLGLTVPFGVIPPNDIRILGTVRHLVRTLTNPNTGGIKRYNQDCYIGGNPWLVTTLWLGMFEAACGNWNRAAGYLKWALDKRTPLGFLPEQIDRVTGNTAWVVPLAWSHAMYLMLVRMLSEAKKLDKISE